MELDVSEDSFDISTDSPGFLYFKNGGLHTDWIGVPN